ncbi:MAG TPA: DUF222 domain-containing protein [Mycobacteriales bacterium]|nr:DUF222 domain-containing protein [Mycobacteriales bacterium]
MLHPATQRLAEDMAGLLARDPHDLPDAALLEDTETLLRLHRRLDGLITTQLQVLDTRDVTTTERGRGTRAWLVEEQLLSRPEANTRMRLARSSLTRPAITDALRAGEIGLDHATTIVTFLPSLPSADQREEAEKLLLEAAKDTDPTTLGRGLRELADRLCLHETAEERAVRRHEGRYLRLTHTIGQMIHLDGMLDPVQGATVEKALTALMTPGGEIDFRTPEQTRADALADLAKLALNCGQLPDTAGEPTQICLIAQVEDLTRQLSPGDTPTTTLDGDTTITPNTLRMLACDAAIIPIVMRGQSEILDLARSTRTWN